MTGDNIGVLIADALDRGETITIRKVADAVTVEPSALEIVTTLRSWFLAMRGIEASAFAIRKALDQPEVNRAQLRAQVESLSARSAELNHKVGNRLASWVLECDLAKQNGGIG